MNFLPLIFPYSQHDNHARLEKISQKTKWRSCRSICQWRRGWASSSTRLWLWLVLWLTIVDIKRMEEKIEEMKKQVIELRTENKSLKFTPANIADNDKRVSFYTGLPMYAALMACFKFLGPVVSELIYWNSKLHDTSEMKKKGHPRTLALIQ